MVEINHFVKQVFPDVFGFNNVEGFWGIKSYDSGQMSVCQMLGSTLEVSKLVTHGTV